MKFETGIPRTIAFILAASLVAFAWAHGADKDKGKPSGAQSVDSGSFGVFLKGQRVLTENFNIEQVNGVSLIKAQIKEAAGEEPVGQKSTLEITPNGELLRYEWSQSSGGSLEVLPNNEFLKETIVQPSGKRAEQAFLMPNTSVILDNNFFVHREVLAWRYLATQCKPVSGNLQCQQGSAEFGVLIPQDRTSIRVRLELVGREKVNIRGADRDLLRLNLSGENFEWAMWVDDHDQFKLMKVAIPADNTEVVRD